MRKKYCNACNEEITGKIIKGMCQRCYGRKWQKENPERIKVASRKRYKENPEKRKSSSKKWREQNPEKRKASIEKYREENPEKCKASSKKYYQENPEKCKASIKKCREQNKKVICIICGKSAFIKYCSPKCAGLGKSGKNCHFWQGGKSFEIYPEGWRRIKKQIRDRDNNRCMRCGRAREEFNRALSVHHIDADKNNCNPNNLITLCDYVKGSCHGLTRGKEEFFAEGFRNMLSRLYRYNYDSFTDMERDGKDIKKISKDDFSEVGKVFEKTESVSFVRELKF